MQDERFILRSELNRWLNSFEKDRSTKLDRKTIDRILTKLQEQGQCKCITIHSPVITEYSRTKDYVVVVLPSISLSPELFDEIQDRVRSFNMHIRSRSTSHQKNDELIPIIEDIQKTQRLLVPDGRGGKAEAMRANGFVLAKMLRAKLLHSFLWDYLHRSASHSDALSSEKCVYELTNNPHSSSKLFYLEAAIKAIPVELFLQVVGSTKKYEEMIEKCKMGLRLSDLPPEDYKCLMDTHATGRLSLVIDILRRLKVLLLNVELNLRSCFFYWNALKFIFSIYFYFWYWFHLIKVREWCYYVLSGGIINRLTYKSRPYKNNENINSLTCWSHHCCTKLLLELLLERPYEGNQSWLIGSHVFCFFVLLR